MGNVTAKTSGDIASFMTPAETNIKSLKVHFSPKQLGKGDPSPDNVREIVGWDGVEVNGCGKSLVQFFKNTHTATTLENGYASWSSPWRIPNRERQYTYSVYIDNTNGSERACCKIWFRNQDNTTYVDGTATEGNSIPAGSCGWSTRTIIAKSNTYYFCFGFQINKGCTVSNPIVYESDQGTTIPIDFTNNYLNKVQITNNKTINSTGEEITESGMSVTDYIPVNENEEWLLHFISTTAGRTRRIWGYDENKQPVSEFAKVSWATVDQEYTLTATITGDVKYIRVCYFTNDTDLLLTIDGTSFKNVYGGYVDLISGELVEEYYSVIENGQKSWSFNNYNDNYYRVFITPSALEVPNPIINSNKQFYNISLKGSDTTKFNGWIGSTGNFLFYLPQSLGITTKDEWVNFLSINPLQICYPLTTPITHQLTPTQLQSFIGQNNFWSNADYVEIEYELKETEDIQKARKKIILNQPHIKSISDKIVSFNTDMVAPLKNCKIYFNPIQLGTGDPSPTNVRNINGWTSIDSYANGNKVSVDWTNDIGTVYGGYVDLVKGELVAEWAGAKKKLSEANSKTINTEGVISYAFNFAIPHGQIINNYTQKCNICKYSWNMLDVKTNHFFGYYSEPVGNRFLLFLLENHGLSDETEVDFIAQLQTPIHYQLTPQQLLTFKSTNHIWSETNGQQIDVKYWTHKNLTPTPLTNYIENQTWTDSAYISSSGKKTTNTVSASHFLTNQILLEAGTYVLSGFSHYVGTDNTNFRIHAYDSIGKWLRQITFQQIGNLSPVDISFTLDTDTYVNVSIAMDFDGVLAKIN